MPILDLFENSFRVRSQATAVEEPEHATTYGELDAWSDAVACLLEQAGVRPGDRVLMLLENGARYAAMLLGCWKAGAGAVPLHPDHTGRSLEPVLLDCEPAAMVLSPRRARSALRSISPEALPHVLVTDTPAGQIPPGLGLEILSAPLHPACAREGLRPRGLRASDEDLAMILYTSGTTARSKGVTLSHRNLMANARSILAYLPIRASDRVLAVLPFAFAYGNSVLLTQLAAGSTLVVDPRARYPQGLVEALSARAITAFPGVPWHFGMLLQHPALLARPLPTLRYMTSAGSRLETRHILALRRLLGWVELHVMYGQTEATARIATLDPARLPDKVGSVGRAIPGVEILVVRPDGTPAAPGETGEIIVRGENVMVGYWNDPEETALVVRDGWLHTGDLARTDEEGFIWIVDRQRDMIKKGAVRVSPHEIEEALRGIDTVAECAVVGVPDPVLGEDIEAFVVLRTGNARVGERDILRRLACELPRYKLPRRVHVVADLPRTTTGKVQRSLLREKAASIERGRDG